MKDGHYLRNYLKSFKYFSDRFFLLIETLIEVLRAKYILLRSSEMKSYLVIGKFSTLFQFLNLLKFPL